METGYNNMLICKHYNPQSFDKMTPEEVSKFSCRQARNARTSLRLTAEEEKRFANSIFESICYFNNRSLDYIRYIRYLNECKKQQEYEERQRAKEKICNGHQIIVR